ncbi:potassium transporter TrkA [Salinadaptatus halalkaliphilus]|uniref:Potassium transporter TrkA n=1 Tax=Salinadaptatus halalkaliphilus TaxID=2419781 RepID=A0A4S3TPT3_9EURY|nr:TrkA C-terminal domain-containing protein [Salinadaptatus halalkaliphilus]THE66226.1 potassium transporter TrkA [Salinadaptatus halalkaliphilus]
MTLTGLSVAALDGFVLSIAQLIEVETLLDVLVRIVGFAALAGGTAAGVAFLYRWYSAGELPDGVAVLTGITTVAIWLNTKTALQEAIIGETPLTDPGTALYTLAAFACSAIAADAGRRLGDSLARDASATTSRSITDVTQLVRSAGRVTTVELPAELEAIDGDDPIDDSTAAALAGRTFLFPRRLSVDQLRERLITRLERDFGISYVDIDLEPDGTVTYLAVGRRPAGIGPTLAPGTVAVALASDPAVDASPGDAVRIWTRDDESGEARRVAAGELRGVADGVATVVLEADDARRLDPDANYRLVTLPDDPDDQRDLVSLLRAANETVTTVSIGSDDPLAEATVGSLPVQVLALERTGDGGDERFALPAAETRFVAGDIAYVLGRPDALRRVTERQLETHQHPLGGATAS